MRRIRITEISASDARRPASNASHSAGGYRGVARTQPAKTLGYSRASAPARARQQRQHLGSAPADRAGRDEIARWWAQAVQ